MIWMLSHLHTISSCGYGNPGPGFRTGPYAEQELSEFVPKLVREPYWGIRTWNQSRKLYPDLENCFQFSENHYYQISLLEFNSVLISYVNWLASGRSFSRLFHNIWPIIFSAYGPVRHPDTTWLRILIWHDRIWYFVFNHAMKILTVPKGSFRQNHHKPPSFVINLFSTKWEIYFWDTRDRFTGWENSWITWSGRAPKKSSVTKGSQKTSGRKLWGSEVVFPLPPCPPSSRVRLTPKQSAPTLIQIPWKPK